jgi:hypothetical protein
MKKSTAIKPAAKAAAPSRSARSIQKALETTAAPRKPAKAKGVTLPKTDGARADLLYSKRQERLELNRTAAGIEVIEKELKEYFINSLDAKDSTGVSGRSARVSINTVEFVTITDWKKLLAHCVADYQKRKRDKEEAFAPIAKHLADATVKEMLAAGVKLPGVVKGLAKQVSCVKI